MDSICYTILITSNSNEVKWDAASEPFVHQERVSPWNIEPIEPIRKEHASLLHLQKKACMEDKSLPRFLISVKEGQFLFILGVFHPL